MLVFVFLSIFARLCLSPRFFCRSKYSLLSSKLHILFLSFRFSLRTSVKITNNKFCGKEIDYRLPNGFQTS
ncbi:hypothetical protein F4703DRAFT_1867187 [Phycomyces blakesleeanus]